MRCEAEVEWTTFESCSPPSLEDPEAVRAGVVCCACGGDVTPVFMASSSSVHNTRGGDVLSVSELPTLYGHSVKDKVYWKWDGDGWDREQEHARVAARTRRRG